VTRFSRRPESSRDHFDWVIVGTGFGGSVCALRLAERGYRVLMVEKGRRFRREDFAENNWQLDRWLWRPELGWRGIFKMSFFEHLTVLHGIGVGGGSLVYANTLQVPRAEFFEQGSWADLGDWEQELRPHYATAKRMLGVTKNPRLDAADAVLEKIGAAAGSPDGFRPTDVGVCFAEPGKSVPDPYFGGAGPDRVGCTFCGGCMTGCRVGAKNTLDTNYLYLAERLGVRILEETEVEAVRPLPEGGYRIEAQYRSGDRSAGRELFADRVVLAGGVLGTIPLLLRLRDDPQGLPQVSPQLGRSLRTNNEALIGVIAPDRRWDFSQGVAITSILRTDEHSHLELVRYGAGSGFFRLLAFPHHFAPAAWRRLAGALVEVLSHPLAWARAWGVSDFARQTQILLYMRSLEQTLSLELGRSVRTGFLPGVVTRLSDPARPPTALLEPATDLARRFADEVGGVVASLLTETLLGVPTTAHIMGGCVMGSGPDTGVIDSHHRVFGYDGLYVIDGSALSANPGVNPALTITALAERAMQHIDRAR